MMKIELADNLHNRKYNCCQAVALAYAEEVGADPVSLFKLAEGFGGGMGCAEGICGALAGAVMLAGFVNSDGNLDTPKTKGATTKLSKAMLQRFREKTGALICKDLKGLETGTPLCSCKNCIKAGVEVAQEVLGFPAE